jgi:TP901 family phage tail tape measure protein
MPVRTVEISAFMSIKDVEAQLARLGFLVNAQAKGLGDKFTAASTQAGGAMSRLGKEAAGWGIPFAGSLQVVGKHLDEATSKTTKLHAALSEAGKVTLLAGGAGLAAVGVEAAKLDTSYETAQAKIKAATGVSETAAKRLTQAFEATAGTSMESGQAMEQAYAGVAGQLKITEGHALSTAEAMRVSAAANDLAEGTGTELAASYGAVARVLQAFHLGASQAGQASDVLYNVSKALNVPVEQVATAVARLHSRLGSVAPSMSDIAGLMVSLGSHGVQGSRGIQVVNTAMQTLVGGSKNTSAVLKALGVDVFNSQGHFIGLQGVIAQLQPKLAGLTQQQQLYAEKALFGAGAAQVMGQVVLGGVGAFNQATSAATRMGSAHQAATAQAHTFHGELLTLRATAETLGGALGMFLIPKLQAVAHALSEGVQWLEKHKAAAQALGAVITGILGTAVAVFAYDKAAAFVGGTKRMLEGIGKLALGIQAGVGKIIASFTAQDAAVDASASNMGAAEGVMVTETEAAAGTIDAALTTTGIGLALVAVGTAAYELSEHWSKVMGALESAAVNAANVIVDALNKVKTIVEDTSSLGIIPLLQSLGVIHGSVIPNIPGVSEAGGSKSGGGMPQLQSSMQFGGVNTAQLPAITRAAYKYHISPNTLMGVYGTETDYGKNVTTSSTGAAGAFQFEPETAKSYNYPYTNKQTPAIFAKQAEAAAHYLSDLIKQHHGNVKAALEQYSGQTPNYAQMVAEHAGHETNAALQKMMNETASGKKRKKGKAEVPYVSPFLDPAGLHRGREDEGIDFSGLHPGARIGAIGAGEIDKIIQGWYKGQPLIEERLTAGSHKGQYVYYAEQLRSLVRAGEKVKAGQAIGTVAPTGTGLELGFGAGGGRTLAQATTGYKEGQVTPAAVEFSKFLGTLGKTGSALGVANQIASELEAREKRHEAQIKRLDTRGSGELKTYESDIQTGSVRTLEKLTGSTTHERSGAHSQANKELDRLIAELRATHEKALSQLAAKLVGAHQSALNWLNTGLKAAQESADARGLQLQATELRDQTQIQASMAAKVVQAMQDAATLMVDGIDQATTALKNAGQAITDQFAAQAQAIKDATQSMTDASNAAVTQIEDKSQTQVDILGERGLYGLNLVAQKQQVQLDQMKTGYDAQIAQAQQALDSAQTATDKGAAATKALVDATTAQQDVLIGQAQTGMDSAKQQTNAAVQNAQQNLDNVTAATDAAVQAAQNAVEKASTGTQAQQQAAAAELAKAQGNQAAQVAQAQAALSAAQNAANSAVQQAQDTLNAAQAHASLAEQEASNALANAEGNASVVLAQAAQVLANTQNMANLSEAEQKALIERTKAEAQTQYAGSGLQVHIEGINPTDAAAIASEIGWVMRTQIPA